MPTAAPRSFTTEEMQVADLLTAVAQFIRYTRDHADVAVLLAVRGYGPGELDVGLALHAAARTAFHAGDRSEKALNRLKAWLRRFRQSASVALRDHPAHAAALGV